MKFSVFRFPFSVYFAIFAKCIGSVVQWIEFKIPVLTIAVRIRSESLTNGKRKAENGKLK